MSSAVLVLKVITRDRNKGRQINPGRAIRPDSASRRRTLFPLAQLQSPLILSYRRGGSTHHIHLALVQLWRPLIRSHPSSHTGLNSIRFCSSPGLNPWHSGDRSI